MAPDFTLASQDGSRIQSARLPGKWVVLYFYPKDGTPGCTVEAHNFQRDIAKYEQHHAVIVGVSVDTAGSHKEFCAKQGLTFKLAADTDKEVSQKYGSLTNILEGSRFQPVTAFWSVPKERRPAKVWAGVSPGEAQRGSAGGSQTIV